MNYKDKDKNSNIEHDELNIKSHLNTSLDLSSISVSEDLINRTLAAIREQSVSSVEETAKTSPTDSTKKVISWNRYTRGLAGVAAAVVIVVVGYNLIQQIPIGMKQSTDMVMPESAVMMESASEETPAEANTAEQDVTYDTSVAMEKSDELQYTITAETNELEQESKRATDADTDTASGADMDEMDTLEQGASDTSVDNTARNMVPTQDFAIQGENTGDIITYTFREIFIPAPELAEYITISDNRNGSSITLNQPEDIEAFYNIMDGHQFSNTENAAMIDPNYTVAMNSRELGTLYTMLVGSNLTVHYTQGNDTIVNTYYAIDDLVFRQELEDFFAEHGE